MVPFYLITGFLGSGKTTFLKTLLKSANDRNILIIQNEFAPTGVDGTELKGEEQPFELIEINNGSVFCSCLMGNFIETLKKATAKYKPDIVYLEASGLADPSTLNQIVNEKELSRLVYLEGSVCIVDAINYEKALRRMPRVIQQIQIADFIVLNKIDLMVDGNLSALVNELKKINPIADIKATSFCKLDELPNLKLSQPKSNVFNPIGSPRPDLQSSVLKSVKKVKQTNLNDLISELHEISIRAKGFVNLDNGKTFLFQSVYDSLKIEEYPSFNGNTEFIVIGEEVDLVRLNKIFQKYVV